MGINPHFAASVSWRIQEILQDELKVVGGVAIYEDDSLRITGPIPMDEPEQESGTMELVLKAGPHTPVDIVVFRELVKGGVYTTIEEMPEGPLWGVVDDLTAAFYPNSHMWPTVKA